MKLIADLHTHTLASGHALCTMDEMIREARRLGYTALAVTDHSDGMPGGPAPYYFSNLVKQPDILEDDFLLLKGIEANVLDRQGTIDAPEKVLPKFDWVVASIHAVLTAPMDYACATETWLRVAENPYIDMIGHPEQREFFFDYDLVTKAFAAHNKVVEINASSATSRPGNEDNMEELARCCMKNGVKIAVNSDAHSNYQMNNKADVIHMLEKIGFPQEQIINTSMRLIKEELKLHNKPIAQRIANVDFG